VWELREQHMIKGYPPHFHLCCCFRRACIHPLCQQNVGSSIGNYKWYEGGPSVDNLLLPVPDPKRPWGDTNCPDCKGTCTGHYLKPEEILGSSHQTFSPLPSVEIQKSFKQSNSLDTTDLARRTLLPVEEVNMWVIHLETVTENRKREQQQHGKCSSS